MPRPIKCRRVCAMPEKRMFAPVEGEALPEAVILTVDEYEAVRLIDNEGLTQADCAERMNVARTTAQQIYDSARQKLARALVEGLPLRIEGGEYRLCDGTGPHCGGEHCRRHGEGRGRGEGCHGEGHGRGHGEGRRGEGCRGQGRRAGHGHGREADAE